MKINSDSKTISWRKSSKSRKLWTKHAESLQCLSHWGIPSLCKFSRLSFIGPIWSYQSIWKGIFKKYYRRTPNSYISTKKDQTERFSGLRFIMSKSLRPQISLSVILWIESRIILSFYLWIIWHYSDSWWYSSDMNLSYSFIFLIPRCKGDFVFSNMTCVRRCDWAPYFTQSLIVTSVTCQNCASN